MKKILSVLLVMFLLTACSSKNNINEEAVTITEDSENIEKNEKKDQDVEGSESPKDEKKEEPKETVKDSPKIMSRDEFIVSTFSKYGYDANLANFRINKQGSRKVVAIYKKPVSKGRPIMNKMVFLEDNETGNHELLFIMVNNQVKYGKDQ